MSNPKPREVDQPSAGPIQRAAGVRGEAGRGAGAAWRAVVDRCAAEAGPLPATFADAWRADLDAAEAVAGDLAGRAVRDGLVAGGGWRGAGAGVEGVGRQRRERTAAAEPGVHALVVFAAADAGRMLGAVSPGRVTARQQLRAAACSVELAYRAVQCHREISDARELPWRVGGTRTSNRHHVLDGDWSITQAAMLVADISPQAYRILVRGYGAVQITTMEGRSAQSRVALLGAAISLGALLGTVPEIETVPLFAVLATTDDGSSAAGPPTEAADISRVPPHVVRVCRWAAAMIDAFPG